MDKKQRRNETAKSNGKEQQGEKSGGSKTNKQNRRDTKNAVSVDNFEE